MEIEIDMNDINDMKEEELISREDIDLKQKFITEIQDLQSERLEELSCEELREILNQFKLKKYSK